MLTWLLVATRIIANPLSNVFQKRLAERSAGPLFIIAAVHALLTLACVPLLFFPPDFNVGVSFWANMFAAGLLAVASNSLLVAALKAGDLSVLGPINAYKSVLGLVLAIPLAHEIPTAMGACGVLLVLAGSYFVIDRDAREPRRSALVRFFQERGVPLRFAAMALSATEAVFLKRALLTSSPPAAFAAWCLLGLAIAAPAAALLGGRWRDEADLFRQNRATYVRLAVTTGLMQFATLFTLGKLQVGYSLALFQLSALLSVFFGHRYFQEPNIRKRLIGSLIMVAGAALIVAFG
jgi:drug/metabolite transporter (DMT)-like permease